MKTIGCWLGKVLALGCGLVLATAGEAHAQTAQRTYTFLTTGNGFGFQYFDTNQNKIVGFLEHPYEYLRANASDPTQEGVVRRNLAYDFYFGVRAGSTSGWLSTPTTAGDPEYLGQDHIIHAPATLGSTPVDSYFFAPFGYPGNALVALLHAPGAASAFAEFNFHMGTATDPTAPGTDSESSAPIAGSAITETGPGGGAMVYVPLSGVAFASCTGVFAALTGGEDLNGNTTCAAQNDVVPGFEQKLGSDGWFGVAMLYVDDATQAATVAQQMTAWANGRTPDKILSDAQAEFETWRKPPPANVTCSADETKLWRQSEAVLRMGQIMEPTITGRTNTGMILASLPPGQWQIGWVRDGMYSTVALARTGHYAEAKAALNFFLTTGPVGNYSSYVNNQKYRISVCRYYGSGEEEADYSGQPTPNVEMDGWGMLFWAVRAYVEASGDTAWLQSMLPSGQTVYQTLISGAATPLENNLESFGIVNADSSIWEVHDGNKRHFAYTTLAAIRGYCDLAALAKKASQPSDLTHYAQLSASIKTAFLGSFLDAQGAIGGSTEGLQQGVYYDGSVAEAFTWNILPSFTGMTATATLNMFDNLKVASGGFERNNNGQSSYDDNEWILVDMRISDSLRRAGRGTEADGYVAQVVAQAAANFYLLPELYNAVAADGPIGTYAGAVPMVGYGAGAFMHTLLDRAGLIEPNDCGDGNGVTLPTVTCSGVVTTPPGGSGGGSSGGGSGGGSSGGGSGGSGGTGSSGGTTILPDGGVVQNGASGSNAPYGPAACLCGLRGLPVPAPVPFALLLGTPALLLARRVSRRRSRASASGGDRASRGAPRS